jgi:hypothetical protein
MLSLSRLGLLPGLSSELLAVFERFPTCLKVRDRTKGEVASSDSVLGTFHSEVGQLRTHVMVGQTCYLLLDKGGNIPRHC